MTGPSAYYITLLRKLDRAEEQYGTYANIGWDITIPALWRNMILRELLRVQLEEFNNE